MSSEFNEPSKKHITAVLKDVQSGDTKTLVDLLSTYTNFHWSQIVYDKTGDSVLHCAARLGYANIIDYLLTNFTPKSVDCKNKDDKTPLHEAAQFSQFEACRTLLRHGANVNALKRADWTPLMLACTKNNEEGSLKTIKLLLDSGAIVNYKNKDGWTALHLISREGDAKALNLLLEEGLDIKIRTKNGRTGLHIAALHGNGDVVRRLLTLRLDCNVKDNCGNTPLHEAVLGGHLDICRYLILNKADVHITNNSDYNLLHLAASEGRIEVINFVCIELKFNVNTANKNGLTALHCAARNRRNAAYQYLVEIGGDINVRDNFQRRPSDYF